jgi:hypothetical protein
MGNHRPAPPCLADRYVNRSIPEEESAMRCESCGREDPHFNFAAEYLKDGEWREGVVCWECQKRFASAIRERHAAHTRPRTEAPELAVGGRFLLGTR